MFRTFENDGEQSVNIESIWRHRLRGAAAEVERNNSSVPGLDIVLRRADGIAGHEKAGRVSDRL